MNILVCISKTPETTAPIDFTPDGKELKTEGMNYILNPYDEWYALVRALELKEQNGGAVHVIHVGPAANDIIIRKALAIGADEAYRVDCDPKDAWMVASEVGAFAKEHAYDIIFTGKETLDYAGALVPGMIAELLGVPFISFANHLEYENGKIICQREIEGGYEEVEAAMPLVVSAAKGLAEQRIPNMRGIMMAKRKPLNVIEPQCVSPKQTLTGYEKPPQRTGVKLIDPENMDELVRLLHEEAKVI